jgi:uncharacterized membrane protein YeiB
LIQSVIQRLLACLQVGFVLHMNKTNDKAKSLYTYRRRLLGLLIIGGLHALLLRNGDILAPYAITTFIVTFFHRASARIIIIALVGVFLIQALLPEVWFLSGHSFPQRPDTRGGNYWVENLQWLKYWYTTAVFFWGTTLLLLLFGLLLGKNIYSEEKNSNQPSIHRNHYSWFRCWHCELLSSNYLPGTNSESTRYWKLSYYQGHRIHAA